MSNDADHYVLICEKCRGSSAAAKIRAVLMDDLPDGYQFRSVDCMAGCDRPATVGFQAVGKASYLFGDIKSDTDLRALGRFAWQYQESASGWTTATERPEALYTKTLARLPALRGDDPT